MLFAILIAGAPAMRIAFFQLPVITVKLNVN